MFLHCASFFPPRSSAISICSGHPVEHEAKGMIQIDEARQAWAWALPTGHLSWDVLRTKDLHISFLACTEDQTLKYSKMTLWIYCLVCLQVSPPAKNVNTTWIKHNQTVKWPRNNKQQFDSPIPPNTNRTVVCCFPNMTSTSPTTQIIWWNLNQGAAQGVRGTQPARPAWNLPKRAMPTISGPSEDPFNWEMDGNGLSKSG
jgi:hypothetical protein